MDGLEDDDSKGDRVKVISLFSGAGISDVGFAQAGCEHLAQVEIDKTASSVRRRHFQDTEHFEDIHEFNAIRYRGSCDVVAGGFPCQDYSVAGKREGILGDRGALWWQMLRVIDEAKPAYVWGENVPGLLSADNGRSFRAIVLSLVQLGYSVTWRVLDLRYFGVPQRRRRVFIVGTRVAGACWGSSGVRIFEPDCLPWNSQAGGEARKNDPAIVGTLSANGGGTTRPAGNANELDFCIPIAAETLTAHHHRNDSSVETYLPILAGTIDHHSGVSGGMCNEKDFLIANTARVRRLLPVECERLMGVPDGYTALGVNGEKISDSARYRMLGNGWSVPQAKWLAERFVGATK